MSGDEAHRVAERMAGESYGRLVALLAARTRDVAGAEDALGDAFAAALRTWPVDGVPNNPDAWLRTAARRRQTDAIRRRQVRTDAEEQVKVIINEIGAMAGERDAIPDRRLALMFSGGYRRPAPRVVDPPPDVTLESHAGIFFDMTGAAVSHAVCGDAVWHVVVTRSFAACTVASWALRPPHRILGAL